MHKSQLKGDFEWQTSEQLLINLTNRSNCKVELFLTNRLKDIHACITQHPIPIHFIFSI